MGGKEKPAEATPRRPLTPWELPQLLVPMHEYRKAVVKRPKQRKHYAAILAFVYRNRFAVASQIQRRFAEHLKSDRTARRHLAEMEALGWLDVAPTRSTSPLWPKVYFVTRRGASRLRKALVQNGRSGDVIRVDRSRREGYSADHVLHEVLTTEFLLAVWQTAAAQDDLDIHRIERRSLSSHRSFRVGVAGRPTRLVPDAMFLYRQQGRGMMCSFVELDTGSMSLAQIETKLERYECWSQSSAGREFLLDLYTRHGAKRPSAAFRILFIATARTSESADKRVEQILEISRLFPTVRERLWITTAHLLQKHQTDPQPLATIDWRRMPLPRCANPPRIDHETADGIVRQRLFA